ncbi:MAG TPA: bifunctional adenosylcobinamide kinase/adenosylcobinamide-phosphate guanylyltransferase [Bryobacteraceae bacterium]|nr:bifunctional adenosylcobinamide kinase/adenosylcobinamide-phosphate guanylyltransferase [Bryobacteraceae bacterium]
MSIVLIGGGSRSGKSSYALSLARQTGPRRGFLATAQAMDDEMKQRIARHRQERGPDFTTIEEPLDPARVILAQQGALDVLVIDCLTLWLSNLLLSGLEPSFEEFIETAAESPMQCILVTNEVGCGIVPENALARRFRDLAGTLNQQAAARATAVYWMIFGVPLRVA